MDTWEPEARSQETEMRLIILPSEVILNIMKRYQFPVIIEWDKDSRLYVGSVPGLAGAHTQAATLDELEKNIREVIELCMEEIGASAEDFPRFVGVHQIEIER